MLAFHNLCMHGTAPNHRPDRVRWSIDLRYQPSDLGFGWHNLRDDFETRFPCMTAASADPAKETSWPEWRQKWLNNREDPVAKSRWSRL